MYLLAILISQEHTIICMPIWTQPPLIEIPMAGGSQGIHGNLLTGGTGVFCCELM